MAERRSRGGRQWASRNEIVRALEDSLMRLSIGREHGLRTVVKAENGRQGALLKALRQWDAEHADSKKCWRCGQRIIWREGFGWKVEGSHDGYICPAYDSRKSSTMEHDPEDGAR